MSAMISVECLAPKRAVGEHQFEGFVDFASWVIDHTREGKNVGPMCLALAERGLLNPTKTGFSIKASSNVTFDYSTLRDLAERVGVLKIGSVGKNPYRRDPAVGLEFARELEKLAST